MLFPDPPGGTPTRSALLRRTGRHAGPRRLLRAGILGAGLLALAPGRALGGKPGPLPLLGVEARVGWGFAFGGSTSKAGFRLPGTLNLSVLGDYAIADHPRVSIYAMALYEGVGRGGFGLGGGLRLRPLDNGLRIGLGVIGVVTPYAHGGIEATVGQCFSLKLLQLCLDLVGDAYFVGDDISKAGVDAELGLVLAARFEAM